MMLTSRYVTSPKRVNRERRHRGDRRFLEIAAFSGREQSRHVLYDRLELLGPATSTELLGDLRKRAHLPVERYEIGNVDLLRDCADITVYHR